MERETTPSEREMLRQLPKEAIVGEPYDGGEVKAEEQPINAVIVFRQIDENGNLTTPITVNGDVKITEVETILKLALKNIQQTLGI